MVFSYVLTLTSGVLLGAALTHTNLETTTIFTTLGFIALGVASVVYHNSEN